MSVLFMKRFWKALPLFVMASALILAGCSGGARPPSSSAAPSETTPVALAQKTVTKPSGIYLAGAFQSYSESAYKKALADGKTVMLDFHADWCGTCVSNAPIIKEAFQTLNDPNVVGFKVNYDTETVLKDQFAVRSQATLILVKNGTEVKRVAGPQTVTSMTAFLQS